MKTISSKSIQENIPLMFRLLKKRYGKVRCPLSYTQPHELAVAVILSAQCTDAQVNRITPALFKAFPKVSDYYQKSLRELEAHIHSTGFYHNKAKHIRGFCKHLVEEHNGIIPKKMSELTKMPGVGRKTANVILQEVYRIANGIVVDTHVLRLSKVLGLTSSKNPIQVEHDLMKIIPKRMWMDWSLYMIFLGRSNCTARKRNCIECPLKEVCVSYDG